MRERKERGGDGVEVDDDKDERKTEHEGRRYVIFLFYFLLINKQKLKKEDRIGRKHVSIIEGKKKSRLIAESISRKKFTGKKIEISEDAQKKTKTDRDRK